VEESEQIAIVLQNAI